MKKLLLLLLLFTGINSFVLAQNTIFLDIHPFQPIVTGFVFPERLTVTKTIYADLGKDGVRARANGHIFVLSKGDLVCYNTDAVQIGPALDLYELLPHFDDYLGDLACLVRLKKPKKKDQPYAIMYPSGLIRNLPYTGVDSKGFIDGLAVVYDNKTREHYLIDHHGNVKAKGYYKIGPLTDERRAVCKRTNGVEKWGFLDRDCKVVIEPKYYEVGIFSNQVAWVRDKILSEPYIINQFGGEIHFKNNLFVGEIREPFDFVKGKALVIIEKPDGTSVQKIIDKTGNPLVQGDWLDNFWLTDFDNEHAEYFLELKEQSENGITPCCSTTGKIVHGLNDFRRKQAFNWEGNDGIMPWHPTARACWVADTIEGHIYSEDHTVWRCDNPSDDFFFFWDEFDGIAMWDYKETTFISSSIRKSEKVELGAEFTNVVRILSTSDHSPTLWTLSQSVGTARIPDDDAGVFDMDEDGGALESTGSANNQNLDSGNEAVQGNYTLTLARMGTGAIVISANGNTISSGEMIAAGTQVTVVCTPDEGDSLSNVKLNDSDINTTANGNVHTATFQMPPRNSTISVEFAVRDI